MTENRITVRHSILIAKPRELVWDYTQNYDNRTAWDSSIIEARVLQTSPNRIVQVKSRGNTTMTFVYKLDERPIKTSLATKEVISPIIERSGGSWKYEEQGELTLWTQTNTIVFKQNFLHKLILPIYKLVFIWLTRIAMKKAKKEVEKL